MGISKRVRDRHDDLEGRPQHLSLPLNPSSKPCQTMPLPRAPYSSSPTRVESQEWQMTQGPSLLALCVPAPVQSTVRKQLGHGICQKARQNISCHFATPHALPVLKARPEPSQPLLIPAASTQEWATLPSPLRPHLPLLSFVTRAQPQ